MTKDDISASMKHVVLVGACYLDTILDVPYYPQEDEKLRATAVQVRRGGNCPNSLEVLKQLLAHDDDDPVALHLVTTLPAVDAAATQTIRASFGPDGPSSSPVVDLDHCLYRAGHAAPASCYIFRSAATGARTIVNANPLPEMTAAEFADMAAAIGPAAWWHFEGRMPETTQACVQHLRRVQPSALVSIEIEKPGRPGLQALAGEADVVLFSKTWAEGQGYADAAACLRAQAEKLPRARLLFCTWGAQGASALVQPGMHLLASPIPPRLAPSQLVDAVGAGDTFTAGLLYKLACQPSPPSTMTTWIEDASLGDANVQRALAFATDLATRKVQMEGFRGLGGQLSGSSTA